MEAHHVLHRHRPARSHCHDPRIPECRPRSPESRLPLRLCCFSVCWFSAFFPRPSTRDPRPLGPPPRHPLRHRHFRPPRPLRDDHHPARRLAPLTSHPERSRRPETHRPHPPKRHYHQRPPRGDQTPRPYRRHQPRNPRPQGPHRPGNRPQSRNNNPPTPRRAAPPPLLAHIPLPGCRPTGLRLLPRLHRRPGAGGGGRRPTAPPNPRPHPPRTQDRALSARAR